MSMSKIYKKSLDIESGQDTKETRKHVIDQHSKNDKKSSKKDERSSKKDTRLSKRQKLDAEKARGKKDSSVYGGHRNVNDKMFAEYNLILRNMEVNSKQDGTSVKEATSNKENTSRMEVVGNNQVKSVSMDAITLEEDEKCEEV